MASAGLIEGYADAAFAVAKGEGALQRVTDELYAFAKGLEQHADLREALTDAALPLENRTAIVTELLGERAHPTTVNLIGLVVASGHARELGKIVEHLAQVSAAERQRVTAEVRSAVPARRGPAGAPHAGALACHRPRGRDPGRRRPRASWAASWPVSVSWSSTARSPPVWTTRNSI